jgi:hypothetical protein
VCRIIFDNFYYIAKIRRAMDIEKSIPPVIIPEHPVPYFLAFFTILVTVGIYVTLETFGNLANIKEKWPEYRCQPHMMPLAGLFGYDINENFNFCLGEIIKDQTKGVAAPFAQGMSGFTGVLTNLMNSANSFRETMATLVGGVIKIIAEFKARMTALMGRVKLTASRMKALMYRVYGTMFAVMYMGMSAQTGIANFGDTFIFKFLDTFCFPADQEIELDDGLVLISEILVGDVLKGGSKVETIYKFAADGQEMVELSNVKVSSNHFIQYNGKWIMAKDHPDARVIEPWSGGIDNPLFCLTTHDHLLPIGPYIFADYDETDEANAITQGWVDSSLNGRKVTEFPDISYDIGSPSQTKVLTRDGYKCLNEIRLGDFITETDRVIGIQVMKLSEFCKLPEGQLIARGALLWNSKKGEWSRAYSFLPLVTYTPRECIALFVSPGAKYEIEGGWIVRDAMEVYSPDTKKSYAEVLLKKKAE